MDNNKLFYSNNGPPGRKEEEIQVYLWIGEVITVINIAEVITPVFLVLVIVIYTMYPAVAVATIYYQERVVGRAKILIIGTIIIIIIIIIKTSKRLDVEILEPLTRIEIFLKYELLL